MIRKTIVLAMAALAVAACDSRRGMQVRTFELHRLNYKEAETLLTPYIREGGFISGQNRLLSVREKPDQLDSIAAILKRYDGRPQALTLHFQVIEAGDFEGTDPNVARVAAPLREMLRYRGYRLLSEVTLPAVEGRPFEQTGNGLSIKGSVVEVTPSGPDAGVTLEVEVASADGRVSAAVSGAPGQTLVLGSAQRQGGGALIAAVQPELGAMVVAPPPASVSPAPARP
ncbi:MAG TPA: hypothetical protein VF541_17700 [Longimicrobium sp.]